MRTTIFVATLVVASIGLLAVAPSGLAFGWCTSETHEACGNYIVCIGTRNDAYGFQCQYGVEAYCPTQCTGPPP